MEHLKKATSMKTGRVAMLPPSIYNNPLRMESGGWVLIETPPITLLDTNQTAPAEPTVDTLTSDEPTAETPKKKSRKPKQPTNDRPEAAE